MNIDWSLFGPVLLSWKYLVFLLLAVAGWLLLTRNRGFSKLRLTFQIICMVVFGGILTLVVPVAAREFGLHPSPMCAVTKGTAFAVLRSTLPVPMLSLVVVAVVFSLVGAKAFCGWGCPLGSAQELIGRIPGARRLRFPFRWSNGVRIAAVVSFVIALPVFRLITYDWFNPFEALHWQGFLNDPFIWGPFVVVAVASFLHYRPFCATLCPLGLITWLFDRVSFGRIRINQDCTQCLNCIDETRCQALPALVDRKHVIPDCFGCGECLGHCPESAIYFGWRERKEAETMAPRKQMAGVGFRFWNRPKAPAAGSPRSRRTPARR